MMPRSTAIAAAALLSLFAGAPVFAEDVGIDVAGDASVDVAGDGGDAADASAGDIGIDDVTSDAAVDDVGSDAHVGDAATDAVDSGADVDDGIELLGITPGFGYADGETEVEIEGRGLSNRVRFTIGERSLVDVVYTAESFAAGVVLTNEMAPGVYDLEAWVGDAQVASLDDAFEVLPARSAAPPVITDVFPPVIVIGRSTELTVTGTGFQAGADVDLSGIRVPSVVVDSPTSLRLAIDPGFFFAPGPYSVTVENPDGQTVTLPGALVVRPAPSDEEEGCSAGPVTGPAAWLALLALARRRRRAR